MLKQVVASIYFCAVKHDKKRRQGRFGIVSFCLFLLGGNFYRLRNCEGPNYLPGSFSLSFLLVRANKTWPRIFISLCCCIYPLHRYTQKEMGVC